MEEEHDKKGFAVEPITNCPHFTFGHKDNLVEAFKKYQDKMFKMPCKDCQDASENWICMCCQEIFCSRYVNSHMVDHKDKTKHDIAMSFSDLSFWCYECDFYITNEFMSQLRLQAQKLKFGKDGKYNNLSTEEEKEEFFDSPEVLDQKVTQLAQMIKKSKHFIAFTGAGVSTGAGIPDFRSGANTVLKTGAGAWEEKATGCDTSKAVRVNMLCAHPTKAHLALNQLEKEGYLKFLISQNTDGLHRRGGFPYEKLAELHGNTNLEKCRNCKRQYFRDFCTRSDFALGRTEHDTGRKCDSCGAMLQDSIINFGENLPQWELENGFQNAERADVCLALGSSLRVTPAANMPEKVGKRKNGLVIVNLQKTPLDCVAKLKINAMCDQVMEMLMVKLGLSIPEFKLERLVQVKINNNNQVLVQGVNEKNENYSLFKGVRFVDQNGGVQGAQKKEPWVYQILNGLKGVILEFQGHYMEPNLELALDWNELYQKKKLDYKLVFTPRIMNWEIQKL